MAWGSSEMRAPESETERFGKRAEINRQIEKNPEKELRCREISTARKTVERSSREATGWWWEVGVWDLGQVTSPP